MKYANRPELPKILQDFLNHEYAIRNKSVLTVDQYALDLLMFLRFLKAKENNDPSPASLDDIDVSKVDIGFLQRVSLTDAYAFLSYCKLVRNNDAAARARKTSSIRAFYRYLSIQKKLKGENPMQELEVPKLRKSQPKYLTLDESIQLLNAVEGKNKERDYCILTLFLNCGLRLAELVSINYTDIKDNNTLTVIGKGNKERTVYLNDACLQALQSYRKVRPTDGVKEKDKYALFLSTRKERISPKTVQHMVYQYLEKAGLGNRGLSVHKLRHTAATLMYQYGDVDVLVLKEILGHENLSTTEIYTHVVDEQLKKATDANPLSKIRSKK